MLTKMKRAGRAELFKKDRAAPDESVTLDGICDDLIIHGTADSVADQILAFRDRVGDFGTLLLAGHDWADVGLARRSMVLMAEQVMPRVNAAIGHVRAAAE
jgi:alkanesulfonate monooxygenase SsuD/methylene tetrahydromethanopterin reductase-like flavin-dependent oxidoreductase (luciferase family)